MVAQACRVLPGVAHEGHLTATALPVHDVDTVPDWEQGGGTALADMDRAAQCKVEGVRHILACNGVSREGHVDDHGEVHAVVLPRRHVVSGPMCGVTLAACNRTSSHALMRVELIKASARYNLRRAVTEG